MTRKLCVVLVLIGLASTVTASPPVRSADSPADVFNLRAAIAVILHWLPDGWVDSHIPMDDTSMVSHSEAQGGYPDPLGVVSQDPPTPPTWDEKGGAEPGGEPLQADQGGSPDPLG